MTESPKPLFLVRLAGTQRAMGAQHGALVAADAERLVDFYRTMPERELAHNSGSAARFVVRTVANAWQSRLARERPPELVARTRAFVDAALAGAGAGAAGIDRHTAMRTFATMDSLQNCVSVVARARIGPFANPFVERATAAAIPACSTLIAWGHATEDGELLFGRNFDFPGVGVWDAAPAFVVCAPTGGQHYGFFTTRGADTCVVTAVNEAGLVLAPHTRWHRGVTWGGAMIVDLVHEIARKAETLADAIAIAKERPASSSWGIAIGSARERAACVIELAGQHVEIVRPPPGAEHLICNNRYRSDAMQAGQLAANVTWPLHSDRREQRLRQLFTQRERPLTPRDIARFLGDRRDPEAPALERRFGGILAQPVNVHCAVTKPTARHAWVGVDRAPVCEGAWAELAWTWDGPTGAWELGATGQSGFTAAIAPDFVAPHDPATRSVHDAVRAIDRADVPAARAALERAIAAAPDDPSLRLSAAWLALDEGADDRAVIHVHAGLATETEPYRRGQLLLWGARAIESSDPRQAAIWRTELAALSGRGLDDLKAHAARPLRRRGKRVYANLHLADAY